MIFDDIALILVLLYLHKKIRFYFVLKKIKKDYRVMKGAEPYFIIKEKEVGVLLLHGFTSTPFEVKELADYLSKKGITTYAPLIKGHGTKVEHLARTRMKDWEKSALDAFDRLSKEVKKVYVVGSSMGGNLALMIATKKEVKGIITMGTPLFFRRERYHKMLVYISLVFKNFIKKKFSKEEKEIIKEKVHYDSIPLNCMPDIIRLAKKSRKMLPSIKAPILIMQSNTDKLISTKNAHYMFNKVGTEFKRIYLVPDSYHVFCMDKHKEKAFKEIYEFISEVEAKEKEKTK